MFNYTKWMVDVTREFIASDEELSEHFPIFEDTAENQSQQSIFPIFTASDKLPCIICKTNENRAKNYTFTQEAYTSFTVEIGINSDLQVFNDEIYAPIQACEYIANKLTNFYEKTLKMRRLTLTDPIPLNEHNTVYVLHMRYSGTHNLVTNTISK